MAGLLFLAVPEFVVDVERRWEALPAEIPIVIGGAADSTGHVVAACAAARALGVRCGQSLREAARLAPTARFVPGILDRYAEAASMLDELVRRWSTDVDWVAIDRAVIPGAAVRRGSLATVADAIQAAIREELGLSSAAGIADTEVAAAVAAALVAPAGRLQVLPGYDARFIAPLDLRWLPALPTGARERLAAAGVLTIGDLAALDPAQADTVIGSGGVIAWRAARAEDVRAVAGTSLPRSLTRALPLTVPVVSADVQLAAEHLADAVAQRLTQIGAFAHAVTVRAVGRDGRFRSQTHTLREASGLRTELAPVARTLAARLWRYGDPPSRISVVASGLTADGPQLSLFEIASGDASTRRARLGAVRTLRSFRALARGSLQHRPRAS